MSVQAIGLALAGFRPVVEIMFADFVTLAMDQICNHAVKFPGMFDSISVPLGHPHAKRRPPRLLVLRTARVQKI